MKSGKVLFKWYALWSLFQKIPESLEQQLLETNVNGYFFTKPCKVLWGHRKKKISKSIQRVGIYVKKSPFRCRFMYSLIIYFVVIKQNDRKCCCFKRTEAAVHRCSEEKVSSEKRKIQSQTSVMESFVSLIGLLNKGFYRGFFFWK